MHCKFGSKRQKFQSDLKELKVCFRSGSDSCELNLAALKAFSQFGSDSSGLSIAALQIWIKRANNSVVLERIEIFLPIGFGLIRIEFRCIANLDKKNKNFSPI